MILEVPEAERVDAAEDGGEPLILLRHRIAEAGAGGVEVGEETPYVALRLEADGRGLDGVEDRLEVGIEVRIVLRITDDIAEELAGVDEEALILRRHGDHRRRYALLGVGGVVVLPRGTVHKLSEVFADEAVEEDPQHVLLEVPAVHGAAHLISDPPDGRLEHGSLICLCHRCSCLLVPLKIPTNPEISSPRGAGTSRVPIL